MRRGAIAVGYPGYLKIFDIRSGRRQRSIRFQRGIVDFVKFSPQGNLLGINLLSENNLHNLQVWDARRWKLLYAVGKFGVDLDFSPDDYLAVTVEDQVYIREARTGREVLRLPAYPYSAGFCCDRWHVWMLYDDGRLEVWQIAL
jgi:hypothetical protein